MKYDPVSHWLSSVNTTLGRAIIFVTAMLLGSTIPQVFVWDSWQVVLFGYVVNYAAACKGWGWLSWLGVVAIPAVFVYFRRFMRHEDSKRDLFIGFSVPFFLFLSLPTARWQVELCLGLYVVLGALYWRLGWLVALAQWTRRSYD